MIKFFIIISLLPAALHCQNSKNIITPDNLPSIFYSLEADKIEPVELVLPFGKIEILDARFDTSKLGYEFHRKLIDIDYKDFRKIKLDSGVANSIQNFYNDYYKLELKDSTKKLLIVLKTLWIDNMPQTNYPNTKNDVLRNSFQDIHVKAEYYAKLNEPYFPLKRIDTVYQLTEENIPSLNIKLKKINLNFFYYTLKSLIEKYDFAKLFQTVNSKRSFNRQQIDSFNTKRFLIPVLIDSQVKRGVYMNFKELAANNPAVTDFKVYNRGLKINNDSITGHTFLAFVDEDGLHMDTEHKQNILKTFFADPQRTLLDINNIKKFNAARSGNTFDFFLYNYIYLPKTTAGHLLNFVPIDGFIRNNSIKTKLVLSPRQFNMETGEIY